MHAYCLFCETNRCRSIAQILGHMTGCTAFAPEIIQLKWVRGIPTKEHHDWLPGYVFLYSEKPLTLLFDVAGIIRVLGKGELQGEDLRFAEMLLQCGGVFEQFQLISVGDLVHLNDPAWKGMNGKVVKVDRGRKRCCVAFDFDGRCWSVWAAYEIVEASSQNTTAGG